MPKKNKEDIKTNDIIEIEEFSEEEPSEEKTPVKPKKSKSKPAKKKKVKVEATPARSESESEEESSEEEPPKTNSKKSKSKRVESPVKKPISQKRLDALQRGREKAAKIRADKKKLELDSIKKQLWEDFNGKVKDKKEAVAAEPPCKEPSSKALEHISKMKSSLPQEPLKLGGNAIVRTFSKIK